MSGRARFSSSDSGAERSRALLVVEVGFAVEVEAKVELGFAVVELDFAVVELAFAVEELGAAVVELGFGAEGVGAPLVVGFAGTETVVFGFFAGLKP